MIFAAESYLWLLIIIPIIVGIFVWREMLNRKREQTIIDNAKLSNFFHNHPNAKKKRVLRYVILTIALGSIIITCADPRSSSKLETHTVKQVDIVFILDVSQSMNALDGDESGQISRLDIAKDGVKKIIEHHPENRYGLIIFAGNARVLSPLTHDLEAFLNFLDRASYQYLSDQGSNLESAIHLAYNRYDSEDESKKSIFILSDGGEEEIPYDQILKTKNVPLFTIGVGSHKGSPILEGSDILGRKKYKSYRGKTVITKLESETLQTLAVRTNGLYYHLQGQAYLEDFREFFDEEVSKAIIMQEVTNLASLAHYFLILAIVLLVIEFLMNWNFNWISGSKKKLLIIALLPIFNACNQSESLSTTWNNSRGMSSFESGKYNDAVEYFQKTVENEKINYKTFNNICSSYYELEEYEKAWEYCKKSVDLNSEESTSWYNLGNSYYRLGEKHLSKDRHRTTINWQEAIKAYARTIELDPQDIQAKENFDFVQKKLKELKSPPPQPQDKKTSKPPSSGFPQQGDTDIDTPLSKQELKLLEEMLSNLAEEERRWQDYFRNKTSRHPFEDLLREDPFFDLDTPGLFKEEKKDW